MKTFRRPLLEPIRNKSGYVAQAQQMQRDIRDLQRAPVRIPPTQVIVAQKRPAPVGTNTPAVLLYVRNNSDQTLGGLVRGLGADWSRVVAAGDDEIAAGDPGPPILKKIGAYYWTRIFDGMDTLWYRSADCETWTVKTATDGQLFGVSGRLYLVNDTTIQKSDNAGDSWTTTNADITDIGDEDDDLNPLTFTLDSPMACSPADPDIIITQVKLNANVAAEGGLGIGLRAYVSTDAGATWTGTWLLFSTDGVYEPRTVGYTDGGALITTNGRALLLTLHYGPAGDYATEAWRVWYSDDLASFAYTEFSTANSFGGSSGSFARRVKGPFALALQSDGVNVWTSPDGATWTAKPDAPFDDLSGTERIRSIHWDVRDRLWVAAFNAADAIVAVSSGGDWQDATRNLRTLIDSDIDATGQMALVDAP